MKKSLLFLASFLPSVLSAAVIQGVNVKQIYNPNITNNLDYVTVLDTNSVQGTGGVTITTTSSGVSISGGGAGGSSTLSVNQNGVQITSPTAQINFTGAGVSVTATGSTATVNISGGGGGSSLSIDLQNSQLGTSISTINFTNEFTGTLAQSSVTISLTNNSSNYAQINPTSPPQTGPIFLTTGTVQNMNASSVSVTNQYSQTGVSTTTQTGVKLVSLNMIPLQIATTTTGGTTFYSQFQSTVTATVNQVYVLPPTTGTLNQALVVVATYSDHQDLAWSNHGLVVTSSSAVVNVASATSVTSYVLTSLNAQITPISTSDRVKITVAGAISASGSLGAQCYLNIANSGTTNLATNPLAGVTDAVAGVTGVGDGDFTWIDSPNTTNPTTYTVLMKAGGSTPTCTFCVDGNAGNGSCLIFVEDIGPK